MSQVWDVMEMEKRRGNGKALDAAASGPLPVTPRPKLHDFGQVNAGGRMLVFHCPACGYSHPFHTPQWTWNGSFERPTFWPSLMVNMGTSSQCHLFLTDGKIIYQADCMHAMAGKTVDVPDWESS